MCPVFDNSDPNTDSILSARVLALIVPLFPPPSTSSPMSELEPIQALAAYCSSSLKHTDEVFASRLYMLADYVRHAHPAIALLGLRATLALLKNSTDHKNLVIAIGGFREAVEAAANTTSGLADVEMEKKALVREILERWKTRRGR